MVVTNDEESLLLSPDDSPMSRRRRSNVHIIRPTLHSLREEPRLVSLGSFREDSKRKGICYGSVNDDDETYREDETCREVGRLDRPEGLEGSAHELGRRRLPLLNRHWDDVRAATLSSFPVVLSLRVDTRATACIEPECRSRPPQPEGPARGLRRTGPAQGLRYMHCSRIYPEN